MAGEVTGAPVETASAPQGSGTTRRERQRQATCDEIVEVARRLLQTPNALSLRAVAAEMGITAPGLYRYVDSYQELLLLLARSIFRDVIASMAEARDRYAVDDPAAQIVASAAAFRRWALGNHEEYRLLFATPQREWPQGGALPERDVADPFADCAPDNGADEFSAFFGQIFVRLLAKYEFHIPSDDELEPEVLTALSSPTPTTGHKVPDMVEVPAGVMWVFERAWARLYGTITLEVFGHLHPEFIASGVMFRSMMREVGADLGLADDWDRLVGLLRTESALGI